MCFFLLFFVSGQSFCWYQLWQNIFVDVKSFSTITEVNSETQIVYSIGDSRAQEVYSIDNKRGFICADHYVINKIVDRYQINIFFGLEPYAIHSKSILLIVIVAFFFVSLCLPLLLFMRFTFGSIEIVVWVPFMWVQRRRSGEKKNANHNALNLSIRITFDFNRFSLQMESKLME